MKVEPSDLYQIIEYRQDRILVRFLPTGLLACFCGLFIFALKAPDLPPPDIVIWAAAAIATGGGFIGVSLWRLFRRGRPIYVLSPMGILLRVPCVKEILIPWREIKGVDSADIRRLHWATRIPRYLTYRDVTVVLVSKQFYDSHIFVNSRFLRGPGWAGSFIPKDPFVQCALHHELVSVDPRALREAVEARWRAFRDQPASSAAPEGHASATPTRASVPVITARRRATGPSDAAARSTPTLHIVAAGRSPRSISWWEGVEIIVPLIGIVVVVTNLLGLWATQAQTKRYEEKKQWAEWNVQFEERQKKLNEEQKKNSEKWDEFWRRN